MPNIAALIPQLQTWNDGNGISPEDWLCGVARSDEAVAYTAFFWPKLVIHKDYVLRHDFSLKNLEINEAARSTRQQIEAMLNYNSLEHFFRGDGEVEAVADERARYVGAIMVDMLDAKLRRDMPGRQFRVALIDDDEDFAVTFWQV
ncbi:MULTISPECIES: hypothetical protein [Sphingomonas]|jgi:hypothetical protein|uniref:hypothetical protein n=1 Tax=Sphingomonas TaxID=13687 RepID=UPI001AEAFCFB